MIERWLQVDRVYLTPTEGKMPGIWSNEISSMVNLFRPSYERSDEDALRQV